MSNMRHLDCVQRFKRAVVISAHKRQLSCGFNLTSHMLYMEQAFELNSACRHIRVCVLVRVCVRV